MLWGSERCLRLLCGRERCLRLLWKSEECLRLRWMRGRCLGLWRMVGERCLRGDRTEAITACLSGGQRVRYERGGGQEIGVVIGVSQPVVRGERWQEMRMNRVKGWKGH